MEFSSIDIGIYLVGNFTRLYIIHCFFQIFFTREASQKQLFLRELFFAAYFLVNSAGFLFLHFPPNLNLLVNFVGITLVAFTYVGKSVYRIFAVVASLVLSIICEDLIVICIMILGIEDIFVIGIIAADILFFALTMLLKKLVSFKQGYTIPFEEWIIVLIIPLLTLFLSIVVIGMRDNDVAVALGEICLIVINILVFLMLSRLQHMYKEKVDFSIIAQQNAAYENQMAFSQEAERRISSLRHDMKNHFIAIEELAKEAENEKLQAYMKSLNAELDSTKNIISTANFFVDSFLNAKLSKALKSNIKIETDITVSQELFISPKDFCILMGNLLDNAITAAEACPDRKQLCLHMKQNPGNLYICVENSYSNPLIKRGDSFISTKGPKSYHGYGLDNVKQIVEAYDGEISFETEDNWFIVKLLIFEQQEN